MSIGFSDSGCARCCALKKTACSGSDSFVSSITVWAIASGVAMGLCLLFTIIYLCTSKKRNEGVVFRAFTSQSYYVALPVAVRGDSESACGEEKLDSETSIAESVFLVSKSLEDDGTIPVAKRTVPPAIAVRRPQTLTQAQANLFYLDTGRASQPPR